MSRVLHCINSLAIGGVETQVLETLRHWAEHGSGHEHALCAFRHGVLEEGLEPLREAGISCFVLGRSSRYSLRFCRALIDVANEFRPDIVHAHNSGAGMWTRALLRGRGNRSGQSKRKLIVHCRGVGVFKQFRGRTIERLLLGRTDAFVFNSHSTLAVWTKFLSPECRKIVIYNGVRTDRRLDCIAPDDFPISPFTMMTVCRMVPIKALSTQIRTVKVLHDRGMRDVQLIVVGDGPERAACSAEAERLGVAEAVHFEGYQPDPRLYHAKAHVYLCTSYNETFSVTLAEAMLDKMVAVAGRVGGPSEIIEDGVSGFLVPCEDALPEGLRRTMPPLVYDYTQGALRPPLAVNPESLADVIEDVRLRWDELRGLRSAAQDRIVDDFSVAADCRALERFYDELAGDSVAREGAILHE